MKIHVLWAAVLCAAPVFFAVPATAAPPGGKAAAKSEAAVRVWLAQAMPASQIDSIRASAVSGFLEVVVDGSNVLYVSQDAKLLLRGSILDLSRNRDLTAETVARQRATLLKNAEATPIRFSPEKTPAYTLTVFTDIDCGYCRRLHQDMAQYNELGIEIDYLFYPRAGVDSASAKKAIAVWCAADRKAALTTAKAGGDVPPATCENPIGTDYTLGQKVGVRGTPAIFTENGTQIGGYLPPAQMLARLHQLDKESK